jgi:hypothetical protein
LFTSFITDCKDSPLPLNGNVTFNLTTFGENATYTCNNGYQISGNTIRTCDNKGNWSGLLPNCTLVGMFHVIQKLLLQTINLWKVIDQQKFILKPTVFRSNMNKVSRQSLLPFSKQKLTGDNGNYISPKSNAAEVL